VERIYDGAWDEMPMLKSINLNANKLKVITTGSFSNISTLECLKLSNNPIELIENAALKYVTNLREISLSYLNADATQPQTGASLV
jgi:Leucine-rich repeat (LRR) protein